jgi:hypothetical protein
MRSALGRLLAIAPLLAACNSLGLRPRDEGGAARVTVNAARVLDQEGVRSFREGRYADAITYFQAAYASGGPSSELWNIARSKERMDDAQGAAESIDAYLALRDLSPQDRAEAEREAQALRERPCAVTVVTEPAGATVTVDGKPAPGATPLSIELRAGAHTLVVSRPGYAPESRAIQPRFGRAVIVTLDLARPDK